MATDAEWQALVKGLLKAEMKRRSLTYEQLAERLAEIGAQHASAQVLRTKVSRGGFSAVFLVQCLKAMGAKSIRIDEE
jgi:3-mercaptopyruvate sulfurtransferase SseA